MLPTLLLFLGCPKTPEPSAVEVVVPLEPEAPAQPQSVILFIGDGMGPGQVGLLQLFAQRAAEGSYAYPETAFDRLSEQGHVGISQTSPHDRLVVDSACSATQLATGESTLSEVIGVGTQGQALETVLERAEANGKATGLVSDTRITHATPAAFAAHVGHRDQENDIAAQLVRSSADVLFSGGMRHFVPTEQGGKRTDGQDLLAEAKSLGFSVITERSELAEAQTPVLGLFANSGMLDGISDHASRQDAARTEPTLREMSQAAVELLEQDEDGFFLMVEAGQIDWAGHANDPGYLLHEMVKADETLQYLVDYAAAHPEVLLVVTADHETGGFGFAYGRSNMPNEPQALGGVFTEEQPYQPSWYFGEDSLLDAHYAQSQTYRGVIGDFKALEGGTPAQLAEMVNGITPFQLSVEGAERVLASEPNHYPVEGHGYLEAEQFPEIHDFEAFYPFGQDGRTALLARELSAQSQVVWSNGTHTHLPVPVFAMGPSSERFDGLLTHPGVGQALMDAVSDAEPARSYTLAGESGPITLNAVYHGSLYLEAQGQVIWLDPWSKGPLAGLPAADLLLITDIHPDHLDTAAVAAVSDGETVTVAPQAVADKLEGVDHVLANGETLEWAGVGLLATPMYNHTRGPEPGKLYHDKGRGNGYLLEVDGRRIYISGDTACTDEMKALEDIDLALVPMNLPYTMTPQEAASCVAAFAPQVVVPFHYRESNLALFEAGLKGSGVQVQRLEFYPPVD